MSTLKPGPKDSESFSPFEDEIQGAKTTEYYKVIMDGLKNNIETSQAFAIKFSLLIREPVNKVRHLTKSYPATIWKGKRKTKAKAILSLVDEAGGRGRIEVCQMEVKEPKTRKTDKKSGEKATDQSLCGKCGFPIKADDLFCKFCLTPLREKEDKKEKPEKEMKIQVNNIKPTIPPRRLFIYLLVILIAFLIDLIFT